MNDTVFTSKIRIFTDGEKWHHVKVESNGNFVELFDMDGNLLLRMYGYQWRQIADLVMTLGTIKYS